MISVFRKIGCNKNDARSVRRAALMYCAGMAALGWASGAAAQTSAGSTTSAVPSAASSDDPAQAASQLDEVVVTAQRRSQRLVDVPISVTAISGEALERAGVTGLIDVTKTTPGVILNKNGSSLQPTIRGIGTSSVGPGADPNVAIYVDGVYQSSETGNFFELANIKDVEILKGPQGTLFGRNSTGGAILINLRDPSYSPVANVNVTYGRFNELLTSAYVSKGLTDRLAADFSAYYRRSDGWIHDLRTGDDRNENHSLDLRSKLLFEPTDSLKFILSIAHNETSDPTGLASAAIKGNSVGNSSPSGPPIATERGTVSMDLAPVIEVKSDSVSLHGSLDTSFGTLASITSYRDEKADVSGDLDGSYAAIQNVVYHQTFENFTQEVNFTSKSGGPLSYVAGVFYFHEKAGDPYFNINNVQVLHAYLTTDAYSVYADGSYKIGNLTVIGGLRYSTEDKSFLFGPGAGPYNPEASSTFSKLTPRFGLSYALTDHSNIYATYSLGFKSGTYNIASPSTVPVLQETVDAYEVGYKIQNPAFTFNTSAYYYQYDNIQITAFDFSAGVSRLVNAAEAEIYGADMDATVHVNDNFDLRAGAAYTHAEFGSFPGAIVFTPRPNNAGNTSSIIDAAGNPLIRAPRLTVSGTADYRMEVGSRELDLSLTAYFSSRVNYTVDRRVSQPSYFTLDANLGYMINDHLRLGVYARNITDEEYATYRIATSTRDAQTFAAPRTIGVSASYKY